MPSRAARHVRAPSDEGLLLALLALVCQLALGAVVRPDVATARDRATLAAMSVLCAAAAPASVSTPAQEGRAPHHRHRAAEIPLCPLDAVQPLPAVIPTSSPIPPPILVSAARIYDRPPGRGPPPPTARVGEPRAPPVPI